MDLRARIVKPGFMGLKKRQLQACGRTAIAAAALYWHQHYKGFHFQHFAFQKYAYKRRSPRYQRRKKLEHPEAMGRPLVFSGDSERQAMAAERVEASATTFDRYHARAIISAPNLNFHAAEMTRVTVGEERRLAEEFRTHFERQLLAAAVSNVAPLNFTASAG